MIHSGPRPIRDSEQGIAAFHRRECGARFEEEYSRLHSTGNVSFPENTIAKLLPKISSAFEPLIMSLKDEVIQPPVYLVRRGGNQGKRQWLDLVHFQISEFPLHGVRRLLVKTNVLHQIDPGNDAHHSVRPQGKCPPVVPCIELLGVGPFKTALPICPFPP